MSTRRPLAAVVLAAGEGRRMHSDLPKPLHRLCGRPMVLHVLDALAELPVEQVVLVVGAHSAEMVKVISQEAPEELRLEFVEQAPPRGTGDAVAVGLTALPDDAALEERDVVVLPGDTPLLRPATLAALVRAHRDSDAAATLLTAVVNDPTGYGRIVRSKDGDVARIVEELDASAEQREINEVGTSIYCFRHSILAPSLRRLLPNNSKGEYYLTDVIEVLDEAGYSVRSQVVADAMEAAGVNDRSQLAAAEAELRDRINERWMRRGVTMLDPAGTYIDTGVTLEEDVTIYPGTYLAGTTAIGRAARIGPSSHLTDTIVADGALVEQTVAVGARIGADAHVGPFAVLAQGSRVEAGAVTGPFFNSSLSSDGVEQGG